MRKPCCLNCTCFCAYSHGCCRDDNSDEEVEIENPESTKCEDWIYDEFVAFVSGYQDKEEHDNFWRAKCCPICKSDNIRLKRENLIGDDFYPAQVECLDCGHTSHGSSNINLAIRWWNDELFRNQAKEGTGR